MGRARKNKTHRNAAAQTLAGHLSLARSLSVLPVIGAQHKHTHTHTHARAYVFVCVCVCARAVFGRHCSRAPGYTSRPLIYYTTYLSRAHLLSALARTHSHTPRPPSLCVQKTTQAATAAAECVPHECGHANLPRTRTHTQR
ncbi:Uncharacterized protein FWK35_00032963 [Aphis craccivora]|uniref:Uncharacterized protein n=1 Tax=Aphis craccivora TaxID=307492 RepID=A0A6G0YI75_APHCR|nr:Uncharacterized protein FWK35_00032963 [Aphis craccivora]